MQPRTSSSFTGILGVSSFVSAMGADVQAFSWASLYGSKDTHIGARPAPAPSSYDLSDTSRRQWLPLLSVKPLKPVNPERERTEAHTGFRYVFKVVGGS